MYDTLLCQLDVKRQITSTELKRYKYKTYQDVKKQVYITHICQAKRPDTRSLIATGLRMASGTGLPTSRATWPSD